VPRCHDGLLVHHCGWKHEHIVIYLASSSSGGGTGLVEHIRKLTGHGWSGNGGRTGVEHDWDDTLGCRIKG